jgi:hypothetical protein
MALKMYRRSSCKVGELREKRGDTRGGTIEKKYHVDLGVRGVEVLTAIIWSPIKP